jgi:hypothetical protein
VGIRGRGNREMGDMEVQRLFDMMVEIKTGQARLEQKVDDMKGEALDRVTACSASKDEILKGLNERLKKLEDFKTWAERLVIGSVATALLGGGYLVSK